MTDTPRVRPSTSRRIPHGVNRKIHRPNWRPMPTMLAVLVSRYVTKCALGGKV